MGASHQSKAHSAFLKLTACLRNYFCFSTPLSVPFSAPADVTNSASPCSICIYTLCVFLKVEATITRTFASGPLLSFPMVVTDSENGLPAGFATDISLQRKLYKWSCQHNLTAPKIALSKGTLPVSSHGDATVHQCVVSTVLSKRRRGLGQVDGGGGPKSSELRTNIAETQTHLFSSIIKWHSKHNHIL